MDSPFITLLYICLVWWAATGAVLWLAHRPQRYHGRILNAWGLLSIVAVVMLVVSRNDASPTGAYTAFAASILLWSWHELTFYLGVLTGPDREPFDPELKGRERFRRALGMSLHHEIALALSLVLIAATCWGAANTLAFWSFLLLWTAHQTARLHVLYGVRNINPEWLPEQLSHLRPITQSGRVNRFFSITVVYYALLTLALVTATIEYGAEKPGLLFLAIISGLALLEHLLLVIPIKSTSMWHMFAPASPEGSAGSGAPNNNTKGAPLVPVSPTAGR